jgi:RHS repeat-associated protein
MTYDHSNRMVEVTNSNGGEAYIYAPDNRRVWRSQGVDPGQGNAEQVMLYSPGGQLMGVYRVAVGTFPSGATVITKVQENVYWGGRLIYSPGTGRKVTDRLSSVGNGSTYYPFGEYKASGSTNGGTDTEQFATYKRDGKTGLDYADQRYYLAGLGRFGSVDPTFVSIAFEKPGSLNRYRYTIGDPLNYLDTLGLSELPSYCNVYPESPECNPFFGGPGEEYDPPQDQGSRHNIESQFGNCDKNSGETNNHAFLVDNYNVASNLATAAKIPVEWILAWAAQESNWGWQNPTDNKAIKNGNYFGLTKGENWLNQSVCKKVGNITPSDNYACFSTFYDSARAALFSSRIGLDGADRWFAVDELQSAFNSGKSVAEAFQVIANKGHDSKNKNYGLNVSLTDVWTRLTCLRGAGYIYP